jgi:hypothetical protein
MDNPGLSYGKIIELATPKIKAKIQTLTNMNYNPVTRPNTTLEGELVREADFGAL